MRLTREEGDNLHNNLIKIVCCNTITGQHSKEVKPRRKEGWWYHDLPLDCWKLLVLQMYCLFEGGDSAPEVIAPEHGSGLVECPRGPYSIP